MKKMKKGGPQGPRKDEIAKKVSKARGKIQEYVPQSQKNNNSYVPQSQRGKKKNPEKPAPMKNKMGGKKKMYREGGANNASYSYQDFLDL